MFPNDFFEVCSQDQNSKQNSQKDHPKLLNPRNTVKIVPSNINEIKAIKEETIEESVEHTQQKKNNLKIFISDNSNDEIEPSTSGSKVSQNTPSNSPLIYIEKNNNNGNKNFSLNKRDKKKIENEEILKVTPHFISENKVSCEIGKGNSTLKKPKNQNNDNYKKIKVPLTCENRCFSNYKFNFMFETKGSGVMLPKDKDKDKHEDKKKMKKNAFRTGKKNKDMQIKKHDYSINIKYSRKDSPKEVLSSPINSSLISLNYNTNQTSPQNYLINIEKTTGNKNKLISNNSINNIRNNKNNDDTQKKNRQSRPKSMKYASPQKKNMSQDEKMKKGKINKQLNNKKKSSHSVQNIKKMNILPNLPNNKFSGVKNQLETEFKNLVKILPDNYEEYPEIISNIELIFQNIYGLKDYINKKTQSAFRPKKK